MELPQQGHEAALRSSASAAQNNKPPAIANARPWPPRGGRGGASSSSSSSAATPPPPPKVYRVEPREFRDLVQRLTGAPPTALRRAAVAPPVVQPQPVRAAGEQQAYGPAAAGPWFSFPMAGAVEAAQPQHHQHGAFL